jgi:hypothetical protein
VTLTISAASGRETVGTPTLFEGRPELRWQFVQRAVHYLDMVAAAESFADDAKNRPTQLAACP